MTAKMSRRLVLRGLGGAAIAAPFLGSVADRWAKAEGMSPPPAPRRLICMFTHYGCLTNRWFPANSHGSLTGTDLAGTTLEPLTPYVSKLLLPRGIRAMNEWTTDMRFGQGNDYHTQVVGSYFTCVPITPHSDKPYDLNHPGKFEGKPTAPSLDHVCAQQLSPGGLPFFMRVSGRADGPTMAVSYSASETLYPGYGSLTEALSALTGLFETNKPLSSDAYQIARGRSVLDVVRADLETLERMDMSGSDRQKLKQWKELLVETERPAVSALCSSEIFSQLELDRAEEIGNLNVADRVTQTLDRADLHSNLAALVALCAVNPVIFLKYPGNYVYSPLGIDNDADNLAHRIGHPGLGGTCAPDVNADIWTIDQFYARKFAYLVGLLNSFDEGDEKLLDHTATVWFQEDSDGCAMNLNNMPILQAGGCGGYFKTGWAINVDDGTSDLHRGNSEACADGVTFEDFKAFGTPAEFANAPINKYYCSLMNAIGVKAGPDGFPLVGGTEEVRCFGMYDNTADFASGGANPPLINDPGEFEELRAS